jgi:hypothetical protein
MQSQAQAFGNATQLDIVILNEVKNLVPSVYSLGLYNVKRIGRDEILRVAQNDRVEVALIYSTI